ncbi:hypothetical protein [Amycolatopsis sp. H20-H5]|uniref:hypothetical protein n=1 Tax=Amycolatopsis sp. H20-H5 TaxID=3046309 RepID=UPI002DB5A804|nr:hypothetical protein [Amycolatopsis sp. H20-H5]MEC3980921.1 hypothetical protein [Amycolatopsis sp. H20-H5]
MSAQLKDLIRGCEAIAARLPIPDPFDIKVFTATVQAELGRRIEMIPVTTEPTTPCGLLASTATAHYIFYAANTTGVHQEHIQLHELAHLLCGHRETVGLDHSVAELLMPSLPAATIERLLGRTAYSAEDERQAETLASVILGRAGRAPVPGVLSVTPHAAASTLDRLGSALDPSPARRPARKRPWKR